MLRSLTINNIALISSLSIEFENNLCVLTGETGAGKSIIVDSLAFVLGEKADKTLIRSGEDKAVVEAVFVVENNSTTWIRMGELGFEQEDTIVLFRTMSLAGKNECRINGRICPLSVLKSIACTLVDIFGQSEHVNFLRKDAHVEILDNFRSYSRFDELKKIIIDYNQLKNDLNRFGGSESERLRTLSLLEHEIAEIENANISQEEEDKLLEVKSRVENVEKIANALKTSLAHLTDNENILSDLWLASTSLHSIVKYDKEVEDISLRLQNAKYEVEDLITVLDSKLTQCDHNPAEIDNIITRIDEIKRLKRKYGATVEDVLLYLNNIKQKQNDLIDATFAIEKIVSEMTLLKEKAYILSQDLSAFRKKSAQDFSELIQSELSDLGMPNANFYVEFAPMPDFENFIPSFLGYDCAEFMFSANLGEPLKPLSKVISGGEMSRFMLAVKNITANIEDIPTMIFDEIDVGLSGNIAQMVAKKLAKISRRFQCIVITHLPQVAAIADTNYFISKSVEKEKTITSLVVADKNLKEKEIERLMGGENIGEYSRKHAQELIFWAEKQKNN